MNALAAIQNLTEIAGLRERFTNYSFNDELSNFVSNSLNSSSSNSISSFQRSPNDDFDSSSSSSLIAPPASAKLINFRGHQVAAFEIHGKEMICLPQVYELFLKNMVGGLHTVYTKLRRLDINPLICNVEQVRALRSLGAIQPGVNRCKLIECVDFEKLYDDCTSTCTRPGRPSKRGPYDEWNPINTKKEKLEGTMATSNPQGVFGNLIPQLTTQQLLMQHFVALTQGQTNATSVFEGNEDEEGRDSSTGEESTPLNLSKGTTSDTDSVENMRKDDSSSNNSISDRIGSNSNSVEGSSSGNRGPETELVNKLASLIEIANEQFKQEREQLWKERNEIQLLRDSFHQIVQDERDLRIKLESQRRKCFSMERKYKNVRNQLLSLRAEQRRQKQRDAAEEGNREPEINENASESQL
ncbi:unnamed protein product [Caenorhabditis bovis]|uniref:SKI/SNO/DAC domain-containing protein n=1 Tax=Caenorhabditis bovis TaxID=2654633 RepID=A0A8S1EQL1_9PELO|nr:unnamed protein product [Caenorhabditis bovis]